MRQKFPNVSDYWKLPKKKKENNASYKDDLPNQVVRSAHGYKWFGLWGTAEDSLKKYGIAARCIDLEKFEYECYAPDPDEDDCSIYFITTEGYIEEKVRKSPQLSSFLIRQNVSMKEFLLMEITDKVYAVCLFFNIIELLDLQIDETFERDSIELVDDNVNGDTSVLLRKDSNDRSENSELKITMEINSILNSFLLLVDKKGKEVLSNKRLCEFLKSEKAFKSNPNYEQLVNWMVTCDLPHKIYYLTRKKDWKTEYQILKESFIHQYEVLFPLYAFSEVDVDIICLAFICVIGLISEEEYYQTIASLVSPSEVNEEDNIGDEKYDDSHETDSYENMLDLDEDTEKEDDFEDIENDLYSITRQYHEKKEIDIFVVRTTEKPTKYSFAELRTVAKAYGDGYYSSFTGVKGYVFYTPEDAQDFVNDILDLDEEIEEEIGFNDEINNYEDLLGIEDPEDDFEDIETDDYSITKQYHENKGVDIFVVRFNKRVDEDAFKEFRDIARSYGKGYYSSYRGVNGFVFNTIEDAQAYVNDIICNFSITVEKIDYSEITTKEEKKSVKQVYTDTIDIIANNPIVQKTYGDLHNMELHLALRKVIDTEGVDIINDFRLVNILNDFKAFDAIPASKFILRSIISEGYSNRLLQLGKWDANAQKLCQHFETHTGFNADYVEYLFQSIAYGLGLLSSIKAKSAHPTNTTNNSSSTKNIQRPLNLTFAQIDKKGDAFKSQYKEDAESYFDSIIEVKGNLKKDLGAEVKITSEYDPENGMFAMNFEVSGNINFRLNDSYSSGLIFWISLYNENGRMITKEEAYLEKKQFKKSFQILTSNWFYESNYKYVSNVKKIVVYWEEY